MAVLLQKYPSLQFLVLGDGRRKERLKEIAGRLNNKFSRDCCTVLGYKPDVVPYYSKAY